MMPRYSSSCSRSPLKIAADAAGMNGKSAVPTRISALSPDSSDMSIASMSAVFIEFSQKERPNASTTARMPPIRLKRSRLLKKGTKRMMIIVSRLLSTSG